MTKTRLLPVMALALTLLLPGPAALAQDEPAETANDTIASDDPRLAELEALVPPALSGLPLRENLRLLTGEEALAAMSAEEAALVQAMLDENGKTTADYAAAATFVQTSATDVVILQAHRIEGLDAATAIDTWVQMLSLGLTEPESAEGFISGRPVTLLSDGADPDVPLIHLYPTLDTTWLMAAADQAILEEAVEEISEPGADDSE